MEEELKYSDNALLNLDLFFDNEINFYIEDEGKEYRYETIFNELFNVKIESIFALGGKNNLKKKYKQLKEEERLKKSFFSSPLSNTRPDNQGEGYFSPPLLSLAL